MQIRSLELHNFRNYDRVSLQFNEKLNFFIGENASGKTSLLEAIAYFSLGQSFRPATDFDLIRQGENYFFIRSDIVDRNDETTTFEIGVEVGAVTKKKIKRNHQVLKKTSAMIGSLVCVVFTPDDLALVQAGHKERRSYIDYILGALDGEYLESLVRFNRALRQRNELLKNIQSNRARIDDLSVWNQMFAEEAVLIQHKRHYFLRRFEPVVLESVRRISDLKDAVSIQLSTTIDTTQNQSESLFSDENNHDTANFYTGTNLVDEMKASIHADTLRKSKDQLLDQLYSIRFQEVKAGHSLIGPHRDKIFFLDTAGQEVSNRFSQGQKRTLALSLKVAQFYFLKDHIGKPPVLLVDDVLHELDWQRRRAFLEVLNDCGQAFFTMPSLKSDDELFSGFVSKQIFIVKDGRVTNRSDAEEHNGLEADRTSAHADTNSIADWQAN